MTPAIAAALALTTPSCAVAQPLTPFVEQGKWGFKDSAGQVAIAPRFESASPFNDGLASVVESGKTVFINGSGRIVLRPAFDVVKDFSEGLAAVNIGERRIPNIGLIKETGRWGYIDRTGRLVLPMKFTQADSFSEGLAAVHEGKRSGFIDRNGKMVFEAPFDVSWGFQDGFALVKTNLKMMYLDRRGRRLKTPPLDDNSNGGNFSEGLAAVEIGDKWGYIDKSGALVIPAIYYDVGPFSDGLAAAEPMDSGTERTCVTSATSSYSFRRAYGYIDKTGRMVIPPSYQYADPFTGGLAHVSTCDKASFIDKSGRVVRESSE